MDFETVLRWLIENFNAQNVRFALMGGFAMHVAGYMRSTQDLDMLVLKEDMPKVKDLMVAFGYELIHESEDVSHFAGKLRQLGHVDFLHAHRSYAKNMLQRAKECGILENKFKVKVLQPEDLIGLKVQSSSNDPARYHQDVADIEFLIRMNTSVLNMDLVKEYFDLFHREEELNNLLKKIQNAQSN